MFISVEGADRVGKDTLLFKLDKLTKWHNCNMMRGPAGCLTYDKIYERETEDRYNEAISVAKAIKSTKHLIVYLYADVDTIQTRLDLEKSQGGDGYFAPDNWSIEDVLDLYEENIDFLYGPEEVLKINTSKFTVDEELEMIIDKMNEIRQLDMQLVSNQNSKNIKSPNQGQFIYTPYLPYNYVFTKRELESKSYFNINIDRPYYEMLEKSLEHLLYEYKLGWINDRQIVYTSTDCISFIQILIEDDKILYFVNQRSCDIYKHKLNDVSFFRYFSDKNFPNKNFEVHYNCSVPHKYIEKI